MLFNLSYYKQTLTNGKISIKKLRKENFPGKKTFRLRMHPTTALIIYMKKITHF